MGKLKTTRDTYIRQLGFSVYRELSHELDLDKRWEQFLQYIPKDLKQEGSEPRYTTAHCKIFEMKLYHGGSPTKAILEDWATQNTTIDHLIQVLIRAQLLSAANYLVENVLHEAPLPHYTHDPDRVEPSQDDLLSLPPDIDIGPNDPKPSNHKPCDPDYKPDNRTSIPSCNLGNSCNSCNHGNTCNSCNSDTLQDPDGAHGYINLEYESGGLDVLLGEAGPNHKHNLVTQTSAKLDYEKLDKKLFGNAAEASPVNSVIFDDYENPLCVPMEALREITNNFAERPVSEGGRLLGKGGFGKVYLGIDHNGMKVAIKVLHGEKDTMEHGFSAELETLSKYRHKNLLRLFGYFVSGPSMCIVYDYMVNGSLEDWLACKNGRPPLCAARRIEILKGTTEGLNFINNWGIVHRDVKSANILLDNDFTPKLGDFATARSVNSGTPITVTTVEASMVIGTSAYLAPEAHNWEVSLKLDTFSLGVVMLELLTGLKAFDMDREDKDLGSHMKENCDDILTMLDMKGGEWDEAQVMVVYKLAMTCLEKKKRRPTTPEILPTIQHL